MALERHWWKECSIQLNHLCHQCNESRSVLCTERHGDGAEREGERQREWTGKGGNGESNEGGRQWADSGDQ